MIFNRIPFIDLNEPSEPTLKMVEKGRLDARNFLRPSNYQHNSTWKETTLNGLTASSVYPIYLYLWTDGKNVYYSKGQEHCVLSGNNWVSKTWEGLTDFEGRGVWIDGTAVYYSAYSGTDNEQYVLNGDTWEQTEWNKKIGGRSIWTDGTDIYHSLNGSQYVLNGDTWKDIYWSGDDPYFVSDYIWTDGTNVYYSCNDQQWVLSGKGKWATKTWNITGFWGSSIWTDGINIYYSSGDSQYVLKGDTWETKTWEGLTNFSGGCVWSDGKNVYCEKNGSYYVLK